MQLYNTNKSYKNSNHAYSEDMDMAEFEVPVCDSTHEGTQMTRVWADGHGNVVYQCPVCGKKMELRNGDSRR